MIDADEAPGPPSPRSALIWPATVLAGVITALALPPWGWWPLSFVGVAALSALLDARPDRRGRLAFVYAMSWFLVGMAWMWFLTAPGFVVATAIFGAFHALAARITPTGRWRLVGRPAAHALVEAVRCSFPFGGVPLATFGIAQADGPLLGVARVGGVIAITWVVWQVSVLASAAVGRLSRGRRSGRAPTGPDLLRVPIPATAGAVGAALVIALALVAPSGTPTGDGRRLALVQGGGEQGTRAIDVPSQVVTDRHLEATASITTDEAIDAVIWPENVVDSVDFAVDDNRDAIAAEAARLGVPFVIGLTEDVPDRPGRITNAQIVVLPDGSVTARYDKVRRVPFGEYVPLRGLLEALQLPVDQVPSDAIAGRGPAVLEVPGVGRIGVVISWEVFFSGRARDGVRHGGELVVNPTNGASYTWTILQTQQIASSRLRAVETGRDVVQVAPTGFTAVIDHDGDVEQRSDISTREVLYADVSLRTGRTWYVATGDLPWYSALIATIALSLLLSRRPTRE